VGRFEVERHHRLLRGGTDGARARRRSIDGPRWNFNRPRAGHVADARLRGVVLNGAAPNITLRRRRGVIPLTDGVLHAIDGVRLGVCLGAGFGVEAALPILLASATHAPITGEGDGLDDDGRPIAQTRDAGLGDVELRVGWARPEQGWVPYLRVGVGTALPTGVFLVKRPGGHTDDRYTGLGRGTTWATAELDLAGHLIDLPLGRLGWALATEWRSALHDIEGPEGYVFRWGDELRAAPSLLWRGIGGRVDVAAGLTWQWRGQGAEQIFADTPREPFANGGSTTWLAQPSLRARLFGGWSVVATGRIVLTRSVHGVQPVTGTGASLALQGWL